MPAINHDPTAEEMMLGAFLLKPELMLEPWAQFDSTTFYTESHRSAFDVMVRQLNQHGTFGLHTVMMDLRLAGKAHICLTVAGCLRAYCDEHPADTTLAELIAARLTDLWRSRETDQALAQARQKARDGVSITEVQMEVEALLTAINSTNGASALPTIDELLEEMDRARVTTGYADVDRKTGGGMTSADLNILAARPSVGKSALARGIIRRALERDQRVFWLSQDQSMSQILELEIARAGFISTDAVRGMNRVTKRGALHHLINEKWRDRVVLIDRPLHLTQVIAAARAARPDLIVIDYLQIMNTGHHDEYERITAASMALKGLAQELSVPVLALAQFNRAHRPGEVPSLGHLRGSGQIEQDAAQVWALDRDTTLAATDSQPAKLYILKNKTGPTGMATLSWVGRFASYEDTSGRVGV